MTEYSPENDGRKFTDLHGRGEPPFPSWEPPRPDEPAHGYFVRLSGLNNQSSATASASSFGLNGRSLEPSECLEFAMSFPIEGKERLLFVTPKVNEASVTMAGETFRRRDWSINKRCFCPGCLAEDRYHRFYWDLVAFRRCPFHDQALRCVDSAGREVPWWWSSFDLSPFGNALAERRKQVSIVRPSIEAYILGRFGLLEKEPVPLLDRYSFAEVLPAIEFAGRFALGGCGEIPPPLQTLGRSAVFKVGFDMLRKGDDAIRDTLKEAMKNKSGARKGEQRGLSHLFGWAYVTAQRSKSFRTIFLDRMVEVGAAQNGLARTLSSFGGVKRRTQLVDAKDLSDELCISGRAVREIASALGLREWSSRSYVAFSVEEAHFLRRTVAELIDRNEAAKILDVDRPFFDGLVHLGLVRATIRTGRGGISWFRPQDIQSFATPLLERAGTLGTPEIAGRTLNAIRRSSRANAARLVQQLLDGTLPILGRRGETFGSIVIPFHTKHICPTFSRKRILDTEVGVGMLDAAAALGIDHSVIVQLRKRGLLKRSKFSPSLLDQGSFVHFCKTYCVSNRYASILQCSPRLVPRRLTALGIKVLEFDSATRGGTYLVDRAAARRVLNLQTDPDVVAAGSLCAFTAELVEHVRKNTTFRVSGQVNDLAFRTPNGAFRLFVTIDWEGGILQIGPKYSLRRSSRAKSYMEQYETEIDSSFDGELVWEKDDAWIWVYTSVASLSFDVSTSWIRILCRVVKIFGEFKKHFDPPQRWSQAAEPADGAARIVPIVDRVEPSRSVTRPIFPRSGSKNTAPS